MSTQLDFFLELASPYTYLAATRLGAAAEAAGVTVRWRPFLLGPIFRAQGWNDTPVNLYPVKGRYMWRDVERIAAALELPFCRPDPFPQSGLLAARVALVGLTEGWGEAFCRAVYRAEFGEGRQISDKGVIADLVGDLGVAVEPVLARAQSEEIKAKLRAETEAAQQRGIFGSPSFVAADGELFWGNDRLEQALDWAKRVRQ